MKLRLIKGRSYTDMKSIHADRKNPVIDIDDVKKAQSLVDAGYFEMLDETKTVKSEKAKEAEPGEADNGLPYEAVEAPTAAEKLEDQLREMTASQLKAYASKHGVEVRSSRKEDIIKKLMEADAKAQEARESLRGE